MTEIRSAVIVGASSGVGRAIAEELAARRCSLVVASRSEPGLLAVAEHLRVTQGAEVWPIPFDVTSAADQVTGFVEKCLQKLGKIDALVITAGQIDDDDRDRVPEHVTSRLVDVNLLGPVRTLNAFASEFERRGSGTLVAFSSIAAPVPRSRNIAYATAKTGLETYCLGLRHALSRTSVRVQVYRLGYVDTAMAAGRTSFFPKASPKTVARHVVRNLHRDPGIAYFPRYWAVVVSVLRHLPWTIYRRLDF